MSKIDPNMPLPNHTKIRYEECVAKIFLEWADGDVYQNLIMRDKPDLFCEQTKIGIEVTEAIDPILKEAESLWTWIPYSSKEKAERLKGQMKNLGYEYQGGIQCWGGKDYSNNIDSVPYNDLYSAIEQKLRTLRKGQYYKCEKYELFVESNILIQENWCRKLLEKLDVLNPKQELYFSKIIILSQLSFVFFDFEENKFRYMRLDSQTQSKLVCKAAKMVEEAEENE